MTRNILRVAAISLLALTLRTPASLQAAEKPVAAQEGSQLAKDLIGTWMLVGRPGEAGKPSGASGRLKFFTGTHWCITQSAPRSGVVVFHHGGTYTVKGDDYLETVVEFANENTTNLIGRTARFTIKIEGDTLTQFGIGNPWNEVWKRVK